MVQLIAFLIFLLSLVAIAVILYKKIPVLVQLPQNGHHGFKKHHLIEKAEKNVKDFHFNLFHKKTYLHKLLSKMRVLILKLERKIGETLHVIRKNAQELDKKNGKKK